MSCGYPLLSTCIAALLVQREAGEVVGGYIHIKYSFSKKRFAMNFMDTRVDHKKLQSGDGPFRRFFVRQAEQGVYSDAEKIYTKYMRSSSDISSRREEMASTSWIFSEVSGGEFVRDNGSLLSLQPWIFERAKCSKREEDSDPSVCWNFDWGFSHGSPRRTNPSSNWIGSKKRQDRYNFRPITSGGNIFMPHLCSEKVSVEEYTFNFHPSSHVKDERLSCLIPNIREASRIKLDSFVEQPINSQDKEIGPGISSEKELSFDQIGGSVNEGLTSVIGVPHLPPRKLTKEERKSTEAMPRSLDTSSSLKLCKISDALGSFNGMLLFLLGIAVGVTSSGLSNKTEVERLKKLLKDNNNLVQDLHEELELKDSLTVKQLGNETDGNKELEHYDLDKSIDAFQNSKWDAAALKMDDCMAKVGENPQALSEIEAELEAELERLEQSINASSIGQTTSAFIELDSELIADVVQGEFRSDLFINQDREHLTTDDEEEDNKDASSSGAAHPYNSNYSVSPKELTIRLHRVIESRLEERIEELESALEQSQMKLKLIEASRSSSKPPPFSSSDGGSSNQDSESSKQNYSSLRLDLAGDALIAYDDAYEEFIRLAETEDEKLPSSFSTIDNKKEQAWEQVVWRTGSYEISGTEEEDEDDDSFDEGKDLIQKIVEKTKEGSPALLNAQRKFFFMDL